MDYILLNNVIAVIEYSLKVFMLIFYMLSASHYTLHFQEYTYLYIELDYYKIMSNKVNSNHVHQSHIVTFKDRGNNPDMNELRYVLIMD